MAAVTIGQALDQRRAVTGACLGECLLRLAIHDIGVVTYYGDYQVLDLVGLVNPEVVQYHKERTLSEYVNQVRPDYLLMFPDWDWQFLHLYPGDHPGQYELLKGYKPKGRLRGQEYLLYRIRYP